MRIRVLVAAMLSLLFILQVCAQEPAPSDIAAAEVAWNQYATPQISGNLLYAHKVSEGIYSFNAIDVVSKTTQPFTVAVSITPGVATKIMAFGNARVYAAGTVGVAAGGENVGFAWSAGGAAVIPLKKGWCLIPNVRVLKTSLADFQGVYGIAIGWGR